MRTRLPARLRLPRRTHRPRERLDRSRRHPAAAGLTTSQAHPPGDAAPRVARSDSGARLRPRRGPARAWMRASPRRRRVMGVERAPSPFLRSATAALPVQRGERTLGRARRAIDGRLRWRRERQRATGRVIPTGTWTVDPAHSTVGLLGQAHGNRQRARQVHRLRGQARDASARLADCRAHGTVKVASIDADEAPARTSACAHRTSSTPSSSRRSRSNPRTWRRSMTSPRASPAT